MRHWQNKTDIGDGKYLDISGMGRPRSELLPADQALRFAAVDEVGARQQVLAPNGVDLGQ